MRTSGRMMVGAVMAAACLLAFACGCGSLRPVNANQWAKDYYNQEDTFVAFSMTGVTSIVGTNIQIVAKSYKPPKSIIPKDTSIMDSIAGAAKFAAGAYFGYRAIDTLAARPQVVPQQVVQPQIVTVPAGATP